MGTYHWMIIIVCCAYYIGGIKIKSSGLCQPCQCYHKNNESIADCSYLGLEDIPNEIPRNTTKLLMNGNNVHILRNNTFINVPHLRHLNISNSHVNDIEPMAFSPLLHIHTIDVSYNYDLTFTNFSKATYGLQNSTTLQVLKLDAINPVVGTFVSLKVDNLKHLKGTQLKELYISRNGLIDYEWGSIVNFPNTLEVLVASWNRFYFGLYLIEMKQAKSLRYIDISHHSDQAYELYINNTHFLADPFPPNLEVFIYSHSCWIKSIEDHKVPNKLKKVVFSDNYISSLLGPVYGLAKIETWDLSNNIISEAEAQFFSVTGNNSLRILNISNNLLGHCMDSGTCDTAFRNLSRLTYLDLSRNRINVLPKDVFSGNVMLEILDISNNNLRELNIQLKHMKNLHMLDLSNNQLQALSRGEMKALTLISNLSIYLEGNPLACVCENLNFIEWVGNNQDKIHDMDSLNCRLTNGSYIGLTDIDVVVAYLQSECSISKILIISLTLCGMILLLGTLGLSIGYRYRWKIRYFYYIGRKKYTQLATNDEDETEYFYDAFVSYADTDRSFVRESMIPELEEKAGLKLCIHHRDFLPGEVIASNIVNAIQNSRKTLILLSPSFLKSSWCEFEYNMARMEGVTRRQNIVLVVLYEPVKMKDLPKDMAALLSTNCYLEYNTNEYGSVIFWQKLVQGILNVNLMD